MKTLEPNTLVLEEVPVSGFEKIIKVSDSESGLKAWIAIHSTKAGPALGGVRIYPYSSWEEALEDVTRLARGMTYKSALAKTGLGGGKSVILADPKLVSRDQLRAFGRAIDMLEGVYIGAEDMGSTTEHIAQIAETTPYVVGLSHEQSSGDPAPFTAWGTYRGIRAVLRVLDATESLRGKTFLIQGLGSVGFRLVELLFWAGAHQIYVYDIDPRRVERCERLFGAQRVASEAVYSTPCDVFVPCARGGILNETTIPQLRCRAVAGCANNQLWTEEDARRLHKRDILYAPDFVINAGGLINVTEELREEGYRPARARTRAHAIHDQLTAIFTLASDLGIPTHQAALEIGDEILRTGKGFCKEPLYFHHAGHVYHWKKT